MAKFLRYEDRLEIEGALKEQMSFTEIGKILLLLWRRLGAETGMPRGCRQRHQSYAKTSKKVTDK